MGSMHLLEAGRSSFKSDKKLTEKGRKRRKKGRKKGAKGVKSDGKKDGQYAFIRSMHGYLKCDVEIDGKRDRK
jgi:hypothetical protein